MGWLLLLWPLAGSLAGGQPVMRRAMALGLLAIFVGVYVVAIFAWTRNPRGHRSPPAFLALLAISVAMPVVFGGMWIVLMVFTSSGAAMCLRGRAATGGVAVATVSAIGLAMALFPAGAPVYGLEVALIGTGSLAMRALAGTTIDLRRTRAELARSAVERERHRFARDLHDLLGHTLSLVAMKSELADRLMDTDAIRAHAEVRDVQQAARRSLDEVRDAVSAYRGVDLDQEVGA